MSFYDEEQLGRFQSVGSLLRLFKYTEGRRLFLTFCIVLSLLSACIQVVLPLLIRRGVDGYMLGPAGAGGAAAIAHLAWSYGGLLGVYLLLSWGSTLGLNAIGQAVVQAVRRDVFGHLHRLPIRYFDHNPVGRLTTRVANDSDALAEVFASVIATAVGDLIMLTGVIAAMFVLDWRLALWVCSLLPFLAFLMHWFRHESQKIYRTNRVLLARINAFFQECIQGLGIIKSFVGEARMAGRFADINHQYYETEMRLVHTLAIFRPLVGTAATLGMGLVLWQGGLGVLRGAVTLGTLTAFLSYVKMVFSPIDEMAEKLNLFQQAIIASERLFRILDTPCEESGKSVPEVQRGHIEFRSVSFAYDPDKPVLRDVSFEVRPTEKIALVGPTGSGKTTIAGLLLGFYRLAGHGSGEILVDGVRLEDWDVRALRRSIGWVQQDLFLFRTDLRHNIALFSPVSDEAVEKAVDASEARRLVEQHADGLSHPVNERGSSLSQGERQLLSFARALVKDPPILVLDEATASVDSVTEKAIQESLHHILQGRSALIVAHRLSTIQEADRILVLKKGRLVEHGSHDELMAQNGLYAHLFRTQQLERVEA
ncbi:MAG TPA: ABC transporter ATP-binding protein [Candidatus Xenobia bacterium]|jgi:ATP-binding cassette subfamily B protein